MLLPSGASKARAISSPDRYLNEYGCSKPGATKKELGTKMITKGAVALAECPLGKAVPRRPGSGT